ncbi:65-kDa microtubule-associated protein 6-like [Carex rostrata]
MGESVKGNITMETPCGTLLRELEQIWRDIGEKEEEKERILMEMEMECMKVYRRRVDESSKERAHLHQLLAANEAELSALVACLGENDLPLKLNKYDTSLRSKVANVNLVLEKLRVKKDERLRKFTDIRSQIEKIRAEISGSNCESDGFVKREDHDLSLRRLEEFQAQLQYLQREKSDRLKKVHQYVDEIHALCSVLGHDFAKVVDAAQPGLYGQNPEKSTNISDKTLDGLSLSVQTLRAEKKTNLQKLRITVENLVKLWDLMETSEKEKAQFTKVASVFGSLEEEIVSPGLLSPETLKKAEAEVDRLKKVKASRMKEIALKRRLELEEICKSAHIDPDISTAPEKAIALIDSGLVDPSELVANIEKQIEKVKEECHSRIEITDRITKWVAALDEENWLEAYNQDQNRYSSGRGAHLNLKRAEKARILVAKIPAIVDNLIKKTQAWEYERNKSFIYDGVRLVTLLEEYKLGRQQKEEDKRRYRDQKKIQNLLTDRELLYNPKPSNRSVANLRKTIGYGPNLNRSGSMTPSFSGRISARGGCTPELLTPRSYSGHTRTYFSGRTSQSSATQMNVSYGSTQAESMSFTSISGSELGSPRLY